MASLLLVRVESVVSVGYVNKQPNRLTTTNNWSKLYSEHNCQLLHNLSE